MTLTKNSIPTAAEHERLDGLFTEADRLWDAGDNKAAFKLFLALAEAGHMGAANNVSHFYWLGIGGARRDRVRAEVWYRRAADAGDIGGCGNLGICYRDKGNFRRAKYWFKKPCVKWADGSAAFELGKIYISIRPNWRTRKNDGSVLRYARSIEYPSKTGKPKAIRYLREASASRYISEDEQEEARVLLSRIKRSRFAPGRFWCGKRD